MGEASNMPSMTLKPNRNAVLLNANLSVAVEQEIAFKCSCKITSCASHLHALGGIICHGMLH